MLLQIEHWSGAGNRFVIVDNRDKVDYEWSSLVKSLCKRKHLEDADGLLVLVESNSENSSCTCDFYNPDGSTGVMCGNGARCAIRHYSLTGSLRTDNVQLILNGCSYAGKVTEDDQVLLEMPVHKEIRFMDHWAYVNVGSHHVVINAREFLQSIDQFHQLDLVQFANQNLDTYRNQLGIKTLNVNLAYIDDDLSTIHIRTYENGVFDETESCGTGALSTAVAFWMMSIIQRTNIELLPKSRRILKVHLRLSDDRNEIIGMSLEGDARRDSLPTKFDTNSMNYV